MKISVRNMVLAALFLALCLVLPFLTANNQQLGNALCLMHIPVLLCGFICGAPLGALVGAVAPLLRSALFGMPPMPVVAVPMAFELCAYGLVAGLLYKKLPKTAPNLYVSLVAAMLVGRMALGAANFVMKGSAYTLNLFLTSAFVTALPGIAIQIALIPLLVLALKRANLIAHEA